MKPNLQPDVPLVVIVDDDESLRSSARMLVQSFGFRAEAFASAKDLLQWPQLADASCLILDVFMPEMNGFELQRRLRWIRPRLPVIFMTAHASEENERHALGAGAIALLKKPVADDLLLGTLRRALNPPGSESSGTALEFYP